MKKGLTRLLLSFLLILITLVVFAYARTWGKTELAFRIHINEQLVRESAFGESPTFALWLEDTHTGEYRTVFATRRAAEGDWEGKAEVPVALPRWDEVHQLEAFQSQKSGSVTNAYLDASTGATPEPGYFNFRVIAPPGSKWIVWIEVNLAGDFNESYPEFNIEKLQEDLYKSGQPALLYRAELEVIQGHEIEPELVGMTVLDPENRVLVKPVQGITTASDIFDEIHISVDRPKPRIIEKKTQNIRISDASF